MILKREEVGELTEGGSARPFFASGEPTLASRRRSEGRIAREGQRVLDWGMNFETDVRAHYRRLLKLPAPWKVTEVGEDPDRELILVRLEWPRGEAAACPVCKRPSPVYDHMVERRWRHSGVAQYTVDLSCAVPRCQCPEHGVKTIAVPWAEPGSGFTVLFERLAIQALLCCQNIVKAQELMRLDWDSCQRIMDRAVERGLERRKLEGLRYVGIDEKSFLRGHRYVSLMSDVEGRCVLEMVRDNTEESGRALWQSLPAEQRSKVEAAAMDMWDPYVTATRAQAPQCAIVHDKFHVSKQLNDAVDNTRRAEAARLDKKGDDTFKAHVDHLLTYFVHPITNAISEGFNSKIQAIKSAARGFQNFENFRTRILFFCGKLDLMPHCPT